ncbi:MAG TPA: hemerythrin domain-containing protein, partial [Beijerinckiaceae bacterium]|nr:hemerythrin domain-containing protein [Beijerinckiaceae bacterium]
IADFLRRDMYLHHQDEELDLFPALRRRAHQEDNLAGVLDRLADDHHASEPNAVEIARALEATPQEGLVSVSERIQRRMLALAASEHRHLAIENGLVMAIARVRLTRSDLARMGDAMRARRAT